MAAVRSLGYAIVSATDLDAWKEFAADLLGLQVVEHTADRLLLRMDEKAYRLDVRRSDTDEVSVLGWEVAGPTDAVEEEGDVCVLFVIVKVSGRRKDGPDEIH